MRKLVLVLALLSLAAVGIAACGGDDDGGGSGSAATNEPTTTTEAPADDATGDESSPGAGGSQVQLSADPGGALAYEESSLTGSGPMVQIAFSNPAFIVHDVRVEDASGSDLGGTDIFADGTATADLELEPGEYTFFCSVPGHREAGMEGTLTVE